MTTDVARREYASDTVTDETAPPGGRWQSHPILAALCRVVIALAPLLVATVLTVLAQVFLLAPALAGRGLPLHVVAYVCLAAATILVTVLVERAARRALPLVALLRLTMIFPDETPSRFQMARTAGNPAALARLAAQSDAQGAAAAQVLALLARLTAHERRTRGHSERVRVYADLMAEQLGLSVDDRMHLRLAAVIHDIGKLTVPPEVLLKPGRPTPGEWATLQGHPEAGIELAGPIRDWLGPWTGAINEHHERYDGEGYPRGLAGNEISLAGRIVAVADAFETMTSTRSYKKTMSVTAARKELTDCAGTHFDPVVVRAFTEISLPRLCRRTLGAGILVHLPIFGPFQVGAVQLLGSAAPLGSSVAAGLAGGIPASAGAMAVLASSVAIGVVPASAAVGAPARPASVPVVQQSVVTPVAPGGFDVGAVHPGTLPHAAARTAPPVPTTGSAGRTAPPGKATPPGNSGAAHQNRTTPGKTLPPGNSGAAHENPAAAGAPPQTPAQPVHPVHPPTAGNSA